MGHALMDKVMLQWGDLPGNAYKALLIIASSARDDDPQPVYWGGWERLAIVGLGRRDWPADDDESPEAELVRRVHWETVRQALVKVRKTGAISVKTRGKPGARAEFWLHLDRTDARKPCIGTQGNLADPQGNLAPNYQQSPQKPGGETTSSPKTPHHAREAPADTPKSRHLQAVRDRADREAEHKAAAR